MTDEAPGGPTTGQPDATGPAATTGSPDAAGQTDGLPPRKLRLVAALAVLVFAVDQLSKNWAVSSLPGRPPVHVLGSLQFNLARNTGAAFSFGAGKGLGPWVSLIAIGVVLGMALGVTSRFTVGAAAAGLVAGGALGNLADRAFRGDTGFMSGAVVDFIDLQWWPIFNVADSGVVVGAILLVIAGLKAPA